MMKPFYLALVILLSTAPFASESFAATYHVSDEVSIAMHSGPSRQYRIKAWLPSGSELSLIKRDPNTKYAQVRTDKGTLGWIEGKYLSEGQSVKNRLPLAEKKLAEAQSALAVEEEKVAKLTSQLMAAKQSHESEVASINEARAENTVQLAQLENEITRLQGQIDSMDQTNLMGWFVRGGGVALLGILIGMIIPNLPKKRRRSSDWF